MVQTALIAAHLQRDPPVVQTVLVAVHQYETLTYNLLVSFLMQLQRMHLKGGHGDKETCNFLGIKRQSMYVRVV